MHVQCNTNRPYLTFVPCPTGCGMKNSPRRAGRNRHFSCDIHFRESKILEVKETAGPLCHASWPDIREIPTETVEKTTPALNFNFRAFACSSSMCYLSSGVISPCGSQHIRDLKRTRGPQSLRQRFMKPERDVED